MAGRLDGRIKYGAVAAGALALGAAGAAGADQLLDGSDIKNGSLQLKDLSKKAQKALQGQTGPPGTPGAPGTDGAPGADGAAAPGGSLLVSTVDVAAGGGNKFVAPGADRIITNGDVAPAQVQVPPYPAAGVRIRGLAVRSFAGTKGPAVDPVTVTLRTGGFTDTSLSCFTTAGSCSDEDNIVVPAGGTFQLAVSNANGSATTALVTITLSLEPA